MHAYQDNRNKSAVLALDASPIYLPLHSMLDASHGKFIGSTKELLMSLGYGSDLPRNARALAAMLERLIPNLRAEGIEVKRLGRDPVRRVQILEITKTLSAEEIAAKAVQAAALAKQIEANNAARVAEDAARVVAREQQRIAKSNACAEWLKSVLKTEPMRNKAIYAMAPNFSKDQINAAAIAIGAHEKVRTDGKFWSLPVSKTNVSDVSTGGAGYVQSRHEAARSGLRESEVKQSPHVSCV